jgi:hypothetical protein
MTEKVLQESLNETDMSVLIIRFVGRPTLLKEKYQRITLDKSHFILTYNGIEENKQTKQTTTTTQPTTPTKRKEKQNL